VEKEAVQMGSCVSKGVEMESGGQRNVLVSTELRVI